MAVAFEAAEVQRFVQKRILIVDDEDQTLLVFTRLLRRLSYPVDAARTAEEALQVISANDYRVVVTDLRLSGVSGEEGLDILRCARAKSTDTEVIVVTGYGNPGAMSKAYQLGAAYYFEKPVHPDALLGALEALCPSW